MLKENQLVHVMGDFIIDLLKYSIDNDVTDYVMKKFSSHG